jgi:ribulose-5-phosphate 4-epimerase/fuculose-1-phosphate aldolase
LRFVSANPLQAESRNTPEDIEHARCDLAAVFPIVAHENLHEGIDNHCSHALGDGTILINRRGVHWSRMTRSDILRIDRDGNVIDSDGIVEKTACFIHSAVHRQCPHATTVLHTHMPYATAVACLEEGLDEMLSQNSLLFYGKVSYEDFGGFANHRAEGERMAARIGNCTVTMFCNHGVMVMGPTPGVALHDLYFLERACQLQVLAQSTGQPLVRVPHDIAELTARQGENIDADKEMYFNEMKRILDETEPDYRD